jgi:glucose/arabinose dehydrogenase/sugar lactone lactonase YvrE
MRTLSLTALTLALALPALADGPRLVGSKEDLKPLVTGLKTPESVCIGPDGNAYVTCIGEFGKKGDGTVVVIKGGKAVELATGLDDPKGIIFVAPAKAFFVADVDKVIRIDLSGKTSVWKKAEDFPAKPLFLNDIESDGKGNIFVSDSGEFGEGGLKGKGAKIFRVPVFGKPTVLVDEEKSPLIKGTNGLRLVSEYHLDVLDFHTGELLRVRLKDGKTEKVAEGFGGGDGLAVDHWGRLFLSDWKNGKVFCIERPGEKPKLIAEGFKAAADICLSRDGKSVLVPDMTGGALYAVPTTPKGFDESELPVKIEPAFADIKWEGWEPMDARGRIVPQRPIVLTHAGDGSNRIFLATQHGLVHVFKEGDRTAPVFLDIQDRVLYQDTSDEEGFLGLAFPPDFKKSGAFYVYYTPKRKAKEKMTNRLSRFTLKDGKGDPASEEVLMTFDKPFWNHDGGTICFGPDGMLYIAVGDGGAANDPFNNAQNRKSLLGKILRIDVSKKGDGKPYAIPADNPFADGKDGLPEVYAWGLRNVWRMSFDREGGALWAADVGQNLWEEVNIIVKGGDYGWKPREGLHPFGNFGEGSELSKGAIDPIWEYHHDLGKSITGGHVYRGKAAPALAGKYVYADYVTGHVWALAYDPKAKKATGNHLLRKGGFPVFSFGEDEKGEVYLLTRTPDGKGIHRFVKK